MKKMLFVLTLAGWTLNANAQVKSPVTCGTRVKHSQPKKLDPTLIAQQRIRMRTLATPPYTLKLFVVIIANDAGTNPATTEEVIHARMQDLVNFYAPHDICFMLSGIEQLNSSDLLSQNVDSEEGELLGHLKPDHITIFVHDEVFDVSRTYGGNAYDIPNFYLSVDGGNLGTAMLLPHEIGHCLGLYHTFEDAFDVENVARSGDCRNCDDAGDLLCDTQADRDLNNGFQTAACTINGSFRDECDDILFMEPTNIMSYWRSGCLDHFTSQQGQRATGFVLSYVPLINATAPDNRTVSGSVNASGSTELFYLAKNVVTFDPTSFVSGGGSQVRASGKAVIVKPGTHFNPSNGSGFAILSVNPYCN
jgi:hypothetical protein